MNDDSHANDDPAHTLLQFFDAMERWELDARATYKAIEAGQLDPGTGAAAVRSAVAAIFSRFCSTAPSLERFSPGRLSFGAHQPTYGRMREEVVETTVHGDAAVIRTVRQGPPRLTLRYNLVRTEAGWRIRDDRRRLKADGTSSAWDL